MLPPELGKAVPKRQAEYLAGRWCVKQLYHQQALDLPLPAYREQGPPGWPDGWCGSISHSQDRAAAVLAPTSQVRSLGLDLEFRIADDTAARIRSSILHPQEETQLQADWVDTLTLIFSFKESLYKALNPLLNRFIGFQEVAVTHISDSTLSFTVHGDLHHDFPPDAPQTARWTRKADIFITGYEIVNS